MRMRHHLKISLVAVSCSLILLCTLHCSKNEKTGQIIPRDTFVQVYAELFIVGREHSSDTTAAKGRIHDLFQKHGVSEQDFRRTVARYNEDPVEWKEILSEVIKKLEEKRNEPATKLH